MKSDCPLKSISLYQQKFESNRIEFISSHYPGIKEYLMENKHDSDGSFYHFGSIERDSNLLFIGDSCYLTDEEEDRYSIWNIINDLNNINNDNLDIINDLDSTTIIPFDSANGNNFNIYIYRSNELINVNSSVLIIKENSNFPWMPDVDLNNLFEINELYELGWELYKEVGVDSGSIFVGDIHYFNKENRHDSFTLPFDNWDNNCDLLNKSNYFSVDFWDMFSYDGENDAIKPKLEFYDLFDKFKNVGFHNWNNLGADINTAYGDGSYPVLIMRNKDKKIIAALILFEYKDEKEDTENDD